MPIKDLTERRRIPRLGKLRLGIKAVNANGREYPKAVDYFVVTSEDPGMAEAFRAAYGDKPKAIEIAFPTDHPEDWASQFYRNYSRSRGLVCKGDGEEATRLVFAGDSSKAPAGHDPSGKRETEWVPVECTGKKCPFCEKGDCKGTMFLQFLIPSIPGLGVWQLDTSSVNSILNVNSSVDLIQRVCGKIAMLPLTLRVVPMQVTPGGIKKTVWVLQLDIPVRLNELSGRLMLPEAEDEIPEELYPTPEEVRAREQAEAEPNRLPDGRPVDPETGEVPPPQPAPEPEYVPGFDDPPEEPAPAPQAAPRPANGNAKPNGNGTPAVGHDELVQQWKELYYRCKDSEVTTPAITCQPQDLTDAGLRAGIDFMQKGLKRAGVQA